ncbi:MAG: hypothetical protein RLZZ584_4187 [Pseudomonadota bacterium]
MLQFAPLGDPALRPPGNGVVPWFELADFEAAARRAADLRVDVVKPRRWSESLNWELWLRDPDGYVVVLTSRLP